MPFLDDGCNTVSVSWMLWGFTSTDKPVDDLVLWNGAIDSYQRRRCPSSCKVYYSTDPLPGHYQWSRWCRQKLQGIQNIPSQRVIDLEAAIRQLRQIGCILDSCTISASYEVTQAQKAILLRSGSKLNNWFLKLISFIKRWFFMKKYNFLWWNLWFVFCLKTVYDFYVFFLFFYDFSFFFLTIFFLCFFFGFFENDFFF